MESLNNAWHAASEDMAKAAQAAGAQGANPGAGFNPGAQQGPAGNGGNDAGAPEDVDFEEVK